MRLEDKKILDIWESLISHLSAAGYPTDPRKMREVIASCQTGCTPNVEKSGPDCFYSEGGKTFPAERKSTDGKNVSGAYTGISVQPTWEQQKVYLEKKIKGPGRHYYDRFCKKTGHLEESYYITGDKVHELLLPKLEKLYPNALNKADPRLAASICMTEIKKYGVKVL
tara:strand:- start:4341 stop:4844 length:504 start_codon:yes stop_codon:yes gene_type:complete